MKTFWQAIAATLLLIFAYSCSKENLNPASSLNAQSTNNAIKIDSPHYLGEFYGGGYIFYLDSARQHGFIAAADNQSSGISWHGGLVVATGATNHNLGAGSLNTKKIINALGTSKNYAALLCTKYRGGGYSDWFLPSENELLAMSKGKKRYVPNLTGGNYWSSSETDSKTAYIVHFHRSIMINVSKDSLFHVRAIRQF